jgi:hypothetical protein
MYIAIDRQVHQIGRGDTPEAARADHAAALVYYRRHLEGQRHRLRASRRKHLELFETGTVITVRVEAL